MTTKNQRVVRLSFHSLRDDIATAARTHFRKLTDAELDDITGEIAEEMDISQQGRAVIPVTSFLSLCRMFAHDQ